MNKTNENTGKVNESDINVVAYQNWEKAGRPPGQDMKFWLEAEAQLRKVAKSAFSTPATNGSPLEAKPVAEAKPVTTPKPAVSQSAPSQSKAFKPQQKSRRF